MSLSRTDKLDFSVELGFVVLLGGTLISQLVLFFFIDVYYTNIGYFIGHTIGLLFGRLLPMLLFILLMRACIYLIDIAPLSGRAQLLLSSLVGSVIVWSLVYYKSLLGNLRTDFQSIRVLARNRKPNLSG